MSDRHVTVLRVSANCSDVVFLTEDNSVVTVRVYGYGAGYFSHEKAVYLAKEELKRKVDSEVFCLVDVRLATERQLDLDFMAPFPSDISDSTH